MPIGTDDLTSTYSAQEYLDIAADDTVRVLQATTEEYAIHQYKDFVGASATAQPLWNGQSTQAPSTSAVVLQIYNFTLSEWETIDTEAAAGADTDFNLSASVTLSDYKNPSNITVCRVYQLGT